VQHAKVLRYRSAEDDLLVLAGVGWKPNVVGQALLPSDMRSPPGRTFRTGASTFIDDLPNNAEFDYSDLLRDHRIVSVVNVPIAVDDIVWGVLEVDSEQPRRFDLDDREFLCGFAEIIGRSVENLEQLENAKQAGLDQKIQLQEREALFRELQHRIGNQCAADHLLGQWQAIRRGAGGLAPGAVRAAECTRAQAHLDRVDAVRVRAVAHVPANWIPVRRQRACANLTRETNAYARCNNLR
jgi:transcriptional regulator with GAF, ATPase, and Fis domain